MSINFSPARVKICGITSVADAVQAVNLGVDAIGLVFYPLSPRNVNLEQAKSIALAVGPFVTVVGLFVNADSETVQSVLRQVPLHLLQFHGDEEAGYCQSFNRPYLKAIRMHDAVDVEQIMAVHPNSSGFLLDTYKSGQPGGTGKVFDWQRVPQNQTKAMVLAGGLTPANVESAIISTGVYGVDVSGGVESSPRKKDANKMVNFIRNAKAIQV